jgi:hypothetical protein
MLSAQGAHVEAASHFRRQLDTYGRHVAPARALRMQVRLGRAHWEAGEKQDAARVFRGVVYRWRHGLAERVATQPDEDRGASGAEFSRTLEAVGEAAYLLAELRLDAFRGLARPSYGGDGSIEDVDAWVSRELRPWVVRKAHALRDARDAYDRVAMLGVTEHQIASRARIGQMFRAFMDDLGSAPVSRVTVDGDEQIADVRLGTAAWREPALAQLRLPALAAFEQCLRTAVRTRHFGRWSEQCAVELTRLDARAHPDVQELRPATLRIHDGAIRPKSGASSS